MIAPKVIGLYASVWEHLLNEEVTGNDIIEFSKKLPKLRLALSCCVCGELLVNREVVAPSGCREHFVCKACVGKERDEDKKCEKCEDWSTYDKDEDLMTIIHNYQDFCLYFLTSEQIVRVLEIKHEVDPKFDPFKLIDLVKEGLNGLKRPKKRKVTVAPPQNRGVVPIDIERRPTKTYAAVARVDKNLPINNSSTPATSTSTLTGPSTASSSSTDNNVKKVDAKKPAPAEAVQEDKTVKIKCKPDAVVTSKATTTTIPISFPPAKPSVPVKTATTSKIHTTTSTFGPIPSSRPAEPVKAAVQSPPLVTIKVEVQTTPEKQQSPINDGSESPTGSTTFATFDPLQDPLAEQPKPPPPTPPRPTVSRPPVTSVITAVTSAVSTAPTLTSLPYKITPTSVVTSQSSMAPQIIQIAHPTGIKTVSIRPQQIRFAGIPGGRIPVQIFATAAGTSSSNTLTESIRGPIIANAKGQAGGPATSAAPTVKRRIIFTTATPHDLQRWPDTSKVLQFATGDLSRFPALAGIRPGGLISVGQTSCPISGLRTASGANIRSVGTASTLPLVRPPPNVLTTAVLTTSASGIGQTIFTSNSGPGIQQTHASASTSLPFVRSVVAPTTSAAASSSVGSAVRPQVFTASSTTVTSQVPASSSSTTNSIAPVKRKPEGCRCGNATPTPGKLTCIGQRCACYADRNACSDCKCKGCKNPYVPGSGGKKVLHGVRAFIDPQTNQAIPIIATPIGHGPANSAVLSGNPPPSSTVTQANPPLVSAAIGPSSSFGTIQTGVSSSMSQPVPPFQFIPVRFGPSGTPQYLQIANHQGLQQVPIILSTSGHLQTSSSGITIQGIPVSGLSAAGIHHVSHIQQQRIPQQMNIKPERNPQQE